MNYVMRIAFIHAFSCDVEKLPHYKSVQVYVNAFSFKNLQYSTVWSEVFLPTFLKDVSGQNEAKKLSKCRKI